MKKNTGKEAKKERIKPGAVVKPGTAKATKTGTWRVRKPVWDHEKCIDCGLCEKYCPEGCVYIIEGKRYVADYEYCKGCGICADVCATGGVEMEEELK